MKVKIGDKIYDPNEEPIAILFEDDDDRRYIIKQLVGMKDKEGMRKFAQAPKSMSEEQVREFLKIKETK